MDVNEGVRRRMLQAAKAGETIAYGQLMKEFRIPRGHPMPGVGIGEVVGTISEHEYAEGRPLLSSIVVRAGSATRLCPKGCPGGGFFGLSGVPRKLQRRKSEWGVPSLSVEEQEFVNQEQERVWRYWGKRARGRARAASDL